MTNVEQRPRSFNDAILHNALERLGIGVRVFVEVPKIAAKIGRVSACAEKFSSSVTNFKRMT